MENSILISTKNVLGVATDYTAFDQDILMHINASFATLTQIGIGPVAGFVINDEFDLWTDFIPANVTTLSMVKTYVYLKVRLLFDPPGTSFLISAMNEQIDQYEWRLNTLAEGG